MADVFINTADKILRASRLYWKRLSCHIALVSRRVGFILVEPCVFGGHAVAQLVEALRYKSEGRGFDSRWRHWNFSLT